MAFLPEAIYSETKTKKNIFSFKGINKTGYAQDGELADCENLSPSELPYLTTRDKRTQYGDYSSATALYSWNGLFVVDNGTLYIDDEEVATLTDTEKQFAVVGTNLCILPDKVSIDLENKTMRGLGAILTSLEDTAHTTTNSITLDVSPVAKEDELRRYTMSGNSFVYFMAYTNLTWDEDDGWQYDSYRITLFPEDGEYLILKQGTTVETSINSTINSVWSSSGTPSEDEFTPYNNDTGYCYLVTDVDGEQGIYSGYIHLTGNIYCYSNVNGQFTEDFREGDVIEISGSVLENDGSYKIVTVEDRKLIFTDNSLNAGDETGIITIERKCPDLDYICEHNNRLWGCSNADKTIYASALGDPFNFFDYDGLSTDSYAVVVGSKGDFTACTSYSTSVLFFKEQSMTKLLGQEPSEYYTYNYDIAGVQSGSNKSIRTINEVLFYKGVDGVYVYTGSAPTLISSALGNERYFEAVGGTDGLSYYISMCKSGKEHRLYTYNISSGIWLIEDSIEALDFSRYGNYLYILKGDGKIFICDHANSTEQVTWSATFAPFYEYTDSKKTYSTIYIRANMPKSSYFDVNIRYDGGSWIKIGTVRNKTTVNLPVQIQRCDKFEIKISGKGKCTLLGLTRKYRIGSSY